MDTTGWRTGFEEAAAALIQGFASALPRLAIAVALILLGVAIGWLLRWLTVRLVARLARIRSSRAVDEALRTSGVERVASEVMSRIIFWLVVAIFAAFAGEVLGLGLASSGLAALVRYLPSVLAAVIIMLAGLVLANLARDAVQSLLESGGVSGRIPGRLARFTIVLLASVVATDQLGIDSTLLILAFGIVLAAAVGSAALAFGLGARAEVGNLIALHYLNKSYSVGQRVRIGEVEGRIVELGVNGVVIDSRAGRTMVPAGQFSLLPSCLLGEEPS